MTGSLPQDAAARKAAPMAEGLLWYFPNALAAVAAVSKAGNDQHNPGEPMHHARGKSMDHADCIMRHLVDAGTIDTDGQRHSAKVAWRALALLQEEIERDDGVPVPRNAVTKSNSARQLYDETSAIAAAQDAKLYADADTPGKSPVADIYWNACFPTRAQLDAAATGKQPVEPSRITTPVELAYLASFSPNDMQAEVLRDSGIGDVEPRHPMQAEADRLAGPEDRL